MIMLCGMRVDPATLVIERFGGIRALAGLLGIEPSSVMRWRERKIVPSSRMRDLMRLADQAKVKLTADELIFGGEV
jgi:hypothetical protein